MWEVNWSGGKDDVSVWLGNWSDLSTPLLSMLVLFSGSQEASPLDSVRVSAESGWLSHTGKLEYSRTGRRIITGRVQSLRARNSSVQSSPRPKGEGRAAARTQTGRPA